MICAQATWIVYLNDVQKGGQTVFPLLRKDGKHPKRLNYDTAMKKACSHLSTYE